MRSIATCVLGAALLIGCGQTEKKSDPVDTPPETPTNGHDVSKDQATTWESVALSSLGASADFIAGEGVKESESGDNRYAVQRAGPIALGLQRGSEATLERFLVGQRMSGEVSEVSRGTATLCGVKADTRVVRVAPHDGRGVRKGPDGTFEHGGGEGPARVGIAAAAEVGGSPMLAWVLIDADQRDANDAIESHFFASIQCP